MHRSIATIDKPEFINLQPLDINPLMSKCEIKVFYLGQNRNHSYISKEVAYDMAKTLRGAPIVGYFKSEKNDFRDHGERMVCDEEGIHFDCLTKPYGFVSPDAQVWFQKFEDFDEFGNSIVREYMMTTGYLWTGQYEECQSVIDNGKPHSMEFDEKTLKGNWSNDIKNGMEFFIINDAIFSKLCILGDDIEPCFEGSSVKSPEVSASFTVVNETFKQTLFTMMQDLQTALEGGTKEMPEAINNNAPVQEAPVVDAAPVGDTVTEVENNFSTQGNAEQTINEENQNSTEDSTSFAKKEEDEDDKKKEEEKESKEDDASKDKTDEDDEDKKKKNFALETELTELKKDFSALMAKYSELEAEYKSVVAFKNKVEDEQKDTLINSFYMLSDEDKKEVIENKAKYSLDDIEAKLSVICFRKKVNFVDTSEDNNATKGVTTYNLDASTEENVPGFVSALRANRNNVN